MRRIFIGTVIASVLSIASAGLVQAGDSSMVCVQQQLAELRYDPGPADGLIGGRTSSAAANYAVDTGRKLPELKTQSASQWCAALVIPDGVHVAAFGFAACGVLTVENGLMGYQFGTCDGSKVTEVRYEAQKVQLRFDHKEPVVAIDDASFTIASIDSSRMSGQWTLGSESFKIYFENKI